MKLPSGYIGRLRTKRGGYSKKVLILLTGKARPTKGWKRRAKKREFTEDEIKEIEKYLDQFDPDYKPTPGKKKPKKKKKRKRFKEPKKTVRKVKEYKTKRKDNDISALKLQKHQRKFNSYIEGRFRRMLKSHNINHVWQQPFWNEYRYVCVDFYFPDHQIVIELDGDEHFEPGAKEVDEDRTKWIIKNHPVKEVLRITNKQIKNELDQVEEIILFMFDR